MWRDIPIDSATPAAFAPSVENVNIRFNPQYYGPTRRIRLLVKDKNGTVVFKIDFRHKRNVATASFDWGGQRTKNRGFVDPIGSPYTISAQVDVPDGNSSAYSAYLHVREGSRSTVSSLRGILPSFMGQRLMAPLTRQVQVQYHSIELSWGDYLSNEAFTEVDQFVQPKGPGFAGGPFHRDPKTVSWVWFKLSKMGYAAGPYTTVMTEALGRGILRYRQSHARLYRKLFNKPGADHAIDDAARVEASKIDAALITALNAGDNNRWDRSREVSANIVEDNTVADSYWVESRLFIDVDRFYVGTGQEFNGRRKSAVEKAWCDRPLLPIQAKVYLQDSQGRRVNNLVQKSALGDFRVKWTWTDEELDINDFPRYSAQRPSRTQAYVRRAHTEVAQAVPSTYHNARELVGGIVSGDARRDAVAAFGECAPYTLTNRDDGAETAPSSRDDASTVGLTTIHLRPSIIAGDTFKLKATLVTTNLSPQPNPTYLAKDTGTFAVWRRIRVDAALRWTTAAAFADWATVRRYFEAARMEIVGPVQSFQVSALPGAAQNALSARVNAFFTAEKVWSQDNARDWLIFNTDHVYGQNPSLLEWSQLAAIGAAQFQSPVNIINEMMIWSMQDDFEAWRKDNAKKPTDALKRRSDVLALWTACGGWRQTVAAHFRAAIDAVFNTGNNQCRDIRPAARVLPPLRHDALAGQGAPATRVAILHDLLLDPIENELVAHRSRNAVNIANVRTMKTFLAQIERDARTTDETRKIPVHPILRAALLFYTQAFDDLGAGVPWNLNAWDMEIRLTGTHLPGDAVTLHLQGTLTNANVARTAPPNKDVTFLRVTCDERDAFDFNALKVTYPQCHSVLFTRGAQAAAPRFTLPAGKEAEVDTRHRARLAKHQKDTIVARLTEVFGNLMPQLIDAMEDAMHAQLPEGTRARSGIVMVQYSAHPGPVPVQTGSPLDVAAATNATGLGLDMGLCFIPAQLPLDKAYLVAHELSHCMFLRHWQKAHDVVVDGFSNPEDHDMADANCIMSYSAWEQHVTHGGRAPCDTHFKVDRYKPNFCGKCNLALRGWDLAAQHLAAPLLPARSIDQELLNPEVPHVQVGRPTVPRPNLLQAQAIDLITNILHAPVAHAQMVLGPNTLRFLGNPTLVRHGGHQFFRWVPLGANPIGGGGAIAGGGGNYDLPDGAQPGVKSDVQILAGPNADYGAAWEKNLEFFKTSGGATNVPRDIIFNTHNFLFTPDTPVHEVIHVYQQWDAAIVHEGITELFGLMLSYHLGLADAGNAAQYELTLNPSYMQVTQFAVDELLPRLGLTGLARLYFGNETAVLEKALITGKSTGAFNDACKAGIDAYDMTVAAATLVPIARRPPADTTHDAGAAAHIAYARQKITAYIAAHPRGGADATQRALYAKRIRLDAKIRVFDEALTQARNYRPQVTDRDRIHRLEAWIDETALQIQGMRDEL